jgi:hypothetical protein
MTRRQHINRILDNLRTRGYHEDCIAVTCKVALDVTDLQPNPPDPRRVVIDTLKDLGRIMTELQQELDALDA